MKYIVVLVSLVIFINVTFSQDDDDLILGNSQKNKSGAFFDLSDPTGINIEVNLWGYSKFTGRYLVPIKTTFLDLMSFSGGPTDDSNLEDIRILRNANDSTKKVQVIKLNYNDLLWDDQVSTKHKLNPVLQSGDIILIIKEKRYTFREDLSLYIPIFTTLFSIATFIITLNK
ncbi:MAG: hypothetical protein IT281_01335 [Ignavibacteria bacterium]|nr:hypothetical protein [Ignavibacteria bacterium]MCC7158164.1 hypothetical protein [Ignavibacteria bacterium]